MNDWSLLAAPLAIGAVLLLYRFVGCTPFGSDSTPLTLPAKYEDLIKSDPNLVAYWRLGDTANPAADRVGASVSVPSGASPGTYTPVAGGFPGDDPQSSTAPPGTFDLQQPGLLEQDLGKSVRFNGGFVSVPFKAALNPPQFAIEAWARPTWSAETPLKFYSVITARSDNATGTSKRGYMLYAGPPLPASKPAGKDPDKTYWQVWIGTGGSTWEMLVGSEVQLDTTVHLVASCDGIQLKLWVDGGEGEGLPTAETTVSVAFAPNLTRPLRIAGGKTEQDPPAGPRYPFVGRLQEVAIYKSGTIKVDTNTAHGTGFRP